MSDPTSTDCCFPSVTSHVDLLCSNNIADTPDSGGVTNAAKDSCCILFTSCICFVPKFIMTFPWCFGSCVNSCCNKCRSTKNLNYLKCNCYNQ